METLITNFKDFIRGNRNDPNYSHVSRRMFKGVKSIGIFLADYKKEYSVILENGVVTDVLNTKLKNHDFSISLETAQITKLISLLKDKDYLVLMKEANKLKIPLKYKLRFGKLYLTSSRELGKCKELLEKHILV